MTDFRALCAKALELFEGYDNGLRVDWDSWKDCARAALAEPQPAADGEVAELVAWLRENADDQREMSNGENSASRNLTRAAELLERLSDGPAVHSREPASVTTEPSDEELLELAAKAIDPYANCGIAIDEYEAETECAVEAYGSELVAYARAVLARWGNHPAQPIPVSERLPEAGDCDAEGRCWLGGQQMGNLPPTWLLGFPAWAERFPEVHPYWLPFNALPLPSGEVGS